MKKRQVVLYIVVMLILLTTSVYATISAELGFKIQANNSVYPGDNFQVTLRLTKLEADDGIKAVEGYIDIDENVVEKLTVDSIVTDENKKVKINEDNILPVYDSSNLSDVGIIFTVDPASKDGDYKVVINFAKPITSQDTDLITLNLKVKDGVSVGKHESTVVFKLFKIFTDNAEEKQTLTDKTIALTVSERKATDNNNTNNAVMNQKMK